jgi:hypothetical protein
MNTNRSTDWKWETTNLAKFYFWYILIFILWSIAVYFLGFIVPTLVLGFFIGYTYHKVKHENFLIQG